MELFGLIGSGIGGYQSTYGSSLLENIREEISLRSDLKDPNSVNFNEILGGNDRLARQFVTPDLVHKIQFGSLVTEVTREYDGKFTIGYTKTIYDNVEKGFDHVILAVPFTTLRGIKVTPSLSTPKLRAIRELNYQHASKVMLQFSKRFWNDPDGPLKFEGGGALTTDLPIRNVYFPDHGKDTGRGVVLVSYTWDNDAIHWAAKNRELQIQEALKQFVSLFKAVGYDPSPYFESGEVKNWTTDPMTIGAYAFFDPTQINDLFEGIVDTEADGKIHIAGEHASFDHAWIEGAVQSGIRVALEIQESN